MSIHQILKNLGLNDKEIKVYLALLKSGKVKPAVLAKITKLNRATLYSVAGNLLSKGIIAEDISSKSLYYVPLPPKNLEKILDQMRREIKDKEVLIKKAVGELNLITAEKLYPVPKIVFIEEDGLEKFLFDNLIKWSKAVVGSDGVWWGFQDHSFVENYEKWINASWETPYAKNLRGQIFTNVSEIEKKQAKKNFKHKRDVRFADDLNFTSSVWVAGDYLIMINTRQHPFYLVELHDHALAFNMREMFKKLWTLSQK
ncbi:MAG: TrmB family transcriptional regulator [Candidatus Berkelbacteria bacterium Athens1014_28]|uniref:TrmB family transcriptional regulator n=1 Tax=Candidatus Berkelbacteria bacterium Athens1014_28 TaxID=2017145 RepID=A0A554LPU3_9BACT|nr:MAG: TrmB family transcriptional regulator [Candidatus Berkelbacteria bacterium Athens1014_28]